MKYLRNPDDRFIDLPGYRFPPHYLTADGHFLQEDHGERLAAAAVAFIRDNPL